jgi:hypothetical protein
MAVKGRECSNTIWSDYIPAVTADYAKQLIDTESLELTTAICHCDELQHVDSRLPERDAVLLRRLCGTA